MELSTQKYDQLAFDLYDPKRSGVIVLKNLLLVQELVTALYDIRSNRRNFVARPRLYGTTTQDLSSWNVESAALHNYNGLGNIATQYEKLSHELHGRLTVAEPFDEVSTSVGHYPSTSHGIGPHRDNSFCVNFIAIFVVAGAATFCTARDKSGAQERTHSVQPGDCILLRAPRTLAERSLRPIHYVRGIAANRYTVAFREINHVYQYQISRNQQLNT